MIKKRLHHRFGALSLTQQIAFVGGLFIIGYLGINPLWQRWQTLQQLQQQVLNLQRQQHEIAQPLAHSSTLTLPNWQGTAELMDRFRLAAKRAGVSLNKLQWLEQNKGSQYQSLTFQLHASGPATMIKEFFSQIKKSGLTIEWKDFIVKRESQTKNPNRLSTKLDGVVLSTLQNPNDKPADISFEMSPAESTNRCEPPSMNWQFLGTLRVPKTKALAPVLALLRHNEGKLQRYAVGELLPEALYQVVEITDKNVILRPTQPECSDYSITLQAHHAQK